MRRQPGRQDDGLFRPDEQITRGMCRDQSMIKGLGISQPPTATTYMNGWLDQRITNSYPPRSPSQSQLSTSLSSSSTPSPLPPFIFSKKKSASHLHKPPLSVPHNSISNRRNNVESKRYISAQAIFMPRHWRVPRERGMLYR